MDIEAAGETVLNALDIQTTKTGAGDKEKGFIVKSSGLRKLGMVLIFLFFMLGGAFFFNHWEVKILRRNRSLINFLTAKEKVQEQRRMVSIEQELQQMLIAAVQEKHDAMVCIYVCMYVCSYVYVCVCM
jgi:hypothetical protein